MATNAERTRVTATLFANQMKTLLMVTILSQLNAIVSVQAAEAAASPREVLTFRASFDHEYLLSFAIRPDDSSSESTDTRNR